MSNSGIINWGEKAVLKRNDNYKIVELVKGRKEYFAKCNFEFEGAIGYPYGTEFIVENKQLLPISKESNITEILTKASKCDESADASKDNRDLVDCTQNQSLSTDSIKQMKKEGATGIDILNKLVENSSSFASKTKFSQEKYLEKKKKRHLTEISILKPCTRILCDVYTGKRRSKVLGLRIDTVSQILSHANVHHGSNVLISETCAGLILGAILERQGTDTDSVLHSSGHVFHFIHGTSSSRPDIISSKSPDQKNWWSSRVTEVPMQDLTALRLVGDFPERIQMPNKMEDGHPHKVYPENTAHGDDNGEQDLNNSPPEPNSKKPKIEESVDGDSDRRQTKLMLREAAKNTLFGTDWDALIVATKFHPQDLVVGMLHFLSPGKPLVVYSQFLQPLVELLNCLKKRGGVELLQIHETWLRNYQILPERSHPVITMSGTGGFLLTGISMRHDLMADPSMDYQQRYITAAR